MTYYIESRELRQLTNMESLLPEHPQASTTVKQVQLEFWKMSMEYMKRIDIDLQFYYFISMHDRFHTGPLPDFTKA